MAVIIYTHVKSKKDILTWDSTTGTMVWDVTHKDGLKNYLGDDDSKIQIMWEDDSPTMYHGW